MNRSLPASFRRSALALAVSSLYLLPALAGSPSAPGPIGGEIQLSIPGSGNDNATTIAVDADGDFVVAWRDGLSGSYDIRGRRFNAAGQALGTEFLVNTATALDQAEPAIASDADGDFVVVWTHPFSATDTDIRAQRYAANGLPAGGEFAVASEGLNETSPSVAMDATGNFVVTYTRDNAGNTEIFARRYNAAGAALGAAFQVNTVATGTQANPAIDLDADGDVVIVWESNSNGNFDIRARRYNAAGTAIGGEIGINNVVAGSQRFPDVGLDADGDFVVAWQSDYEIRAQRFSAAGDQQGSEMSINTQTAGNQTDAVVDVDADGDFVVAWQSTSGYANVQARRYNAAGLPQTEEFRVNSLGSGTNAAPALALDADGDVILAWHRLAATFPGIRARRYQGPDSVDVSLFQTDSADPAPTGSPLTYTLSVGNLATPQFESGIAAIDSAIGSATALRVVDALPAGATALTAYGDNWNCTLPVGRVACDYLLPLAASEEASPIFVVLTPPNAPGALLSNVARASANQFDANLLNNREVERTQLVCAESRIEFANVLTVVNEGEFGGALSAQVIVKRTGGSCGVARVTVDTSSEPGGATPGIDYTDTVQVLQWADGDSSDKIALIPILPDFLHEEVERFRVSLSSISGASYGVPTTVPVQIFDNDAAPRVGWTSAAQTVTEQNARITLTAELTEVSGVAQHYDLVFLGTATRGEVANPGVDFASSANNSITIPAGSLSATKTIEIFDDLVAEPNETVQINIGQGGPVGLFAVHVITIADNDTSATPTVSFDIASASQNEATANTVTLRLSAASIQTVTVPYTRSGTATFTTDYSLSRSSPVTFNPGQTERTIVITPVDDTALETSETAILTLGTPTNATLGTSTVHTRTIVDNDGAP